MFTPGFRLFFGFTLAGLIAMFVYGVASGDGGGVDYLGFLREFGDRVFNVHVKDVWWSDAPAEAGVFGGHADFGADGRFWDFRSPGRGKIDFEGIVRLLNHAGYEGPLSVEWEDAAMDREHGATEAAAFVRRLDFPRSDIAFDAAFSE